MANDPNRHSTENDIQITNKHIKLCSLTTREKEIKTTMEYQHTSTRLANFKHTHTQPKYGKNEEKVGYLCITGENGKCYNYSRKAYNIFLQT